MSRGREPGPGVRLDDDIVRGRGHQAEGRRSLTGRALAVTWIVVRLAEDAHRVGRLLGAALHAEDSLGWFSSAPGAPGAR